MAGQFNQDKSMAGWYGTGVYIRGTVVPFYHSATTPGEDHISIHIEKKHHPTRSEKEQTVEMICRPNSKGTVHPQNVRFQNVRFQNVRFQNV